MSRSRFAPHPSVTHVAPRWMKSSEEGRQMGRVKSEKTTGESILRMTTELPSTGDLTIPTIRRFCSHGARDVRRTVANRSAHLAFPCLEDSDL